MDDKNREESKLTYEQVRKIIEDRINMIEEDIADSSDEGEQPLHRSTKKRSRFWQYMINLLSLRLGR